MDLRVAVYTIAPVWLMGMLCWLVALANLWLSANGFRDKRWQRRIKSLNWMVLGTFYFYMFIVNPEPGEVRVLFRIAIGLMVLGEVAYHFDTLLTIAEVTINRAKRLIWHG